MKYDTINIGDKDYPLQSKDYFKNNSPKTLHYTGNLDLLSKPTIGILSSRKVETNIILDTYNIIKQLTAKAFVFISGWASPLEEDLFGKILKTEAPFGIVLAKGIENYDINVRIQSKLDDGKAVILTHCKPDVKRTTRSTALRRNKLVIALSDKVFMPQAEKGTGTYKLAIEAIKKGKPVYTIDKPVNRDFINKGALKFEINI
ncbi:DNA-processing protein DprA [bacterium]|nr:DNA-processing protein DprA [bacterium]